jgi:hypothetical protein
MLFFLTIAVGLVFLAILLSAILMEFFPLHANIEHIRKRAVLLNGELCAEIGDVSRVNDVQTMRIAEIAASILEVNPGQLRGTDRIWGDYFVPARSSFHRQDNRWEEFLRDLADYVAETRHQKINDHEANLCFGWVTFKDVIMSINDIIEGERIKSNGNGNKVK